MTHPTATPPRRPWWALLAGASLSIALSTPTQAAAPSITQIGGANRFDTATEIAAAAYPQGAHIAIVVSGAQANLVDALTAAPLAASLHAPILLSRSATALGSPTRTALHQLGVHQVIFIGAAASISATALGSGITVAERLQGANRYITADLVAKALAHQLGVTGFTSAFVASAENPHLVDALAAAPHAAAQKVPILLAAPHQSTLPANQGQWLSTHTTVIGVGRAAFYPLHLPGTWVPVAGATRFTTATQLDSQLGSAHPYTGLAVTNGANSHLVDALTAAPWIGTSGYALVLANDSRQLPSAVTAFLASSTASAINQIRLLGGTAALPQGLGQSLRAALTAAPASTLSLATNPVVGQAGHPVTITARPALNLQWSVQGGGRLTAHGSYARLSAPTPGLYLVKASHGSHTATTPIVVNGPPLAPRQVYLYAADSRDAQSARSAATAAGIPASQVITSFTQAWNLVQQGRGLVIAVGAPAVDALDYNGCGWTNPAGLSAGHTPFVEDPWDRGVTALIPNHFLNADGVSAQNSQALATDLATYAVSGHFATGTSLPVPEASTAACAGGSPISAASSRGSGATTLPVSATTTTLLNGLDANNNLTHAHIGTGTPYQFVARYLGGECYPKGSPPLTRTEVQAIHADGARILSIYSGANNVPGAAVCGHQTATQGQADAKRAVAEAKTVGQPLGSAIYLDLEPSQSGTGWLTYVQAWSTELQALGYQPGVYSGPRQLAKISAQPWGQRVWGWVTQWTYSGVKSPPPNPTTQLSSARLWQYAGDVPGPGIAHTVDLDSATSSRGMW